MHPANRTSLAIGSCAMYRKQELLAALTLVATLAGYAAPACADGFQLSYVAGSRDERGSFLGGTEMRVLTAHAGRLFAGNGYWEDRPGPEGAQGAQILVLDSAGARWRLDHAFEERLPGGRWRDLAVSALKEAAFATDGSGRPLSAPVRILVASTWDLSGTSRVYARDDATGNWSAATLAQDRPDPNFLPQIRAFGTHRDRTTGADLVFAGQDPKGIFSGAYDPATTGHIRWSATPELDLSQVPAEGISGRNGYLRLTSFAEANGRLYATVGQHIYERTDGATPRWRLIYTNPRPGHSETGLRGLTTVAGAGGDVLLAAVEGNAARVIRIDPATGSETTELDVLDFLGRSWGERVGYTIAAYNDMAKIGDTILIGLMSFIPPGAQVSSGHTVVDVGYGQVESGAWYLVRGPGGRYDLRRVAAASPQPMVAVRAISASPFSDGTVYLAGYDANKAPAHDTAWIAQAPISVALGR
jgi:hypothetical protein